MGMVRKNVQPSLRKSFFIYHHYHCYRHHNCIYVCSVNKSLLNNKKKLHGRRSTHTLCAHHENIRHALAKTALTPFNSFFMMWSASTLWTMDVITFFFSFFTVVWNRVHHQMIYKRNEKNKMKKKNLSISQQITALAGSGQNRKTH